jgi:hypothetical protein
VNRADALTSERLGEKVVWQMLQQHAVAIGALGVAPHELRRTRAKLAEQPAESWSRFSFSSATLQFRQLNDTLAPGRIWCTHPMMRSR